MNYFYSILILFLSFGCSLAQSLPYNPAFRPFYHGVASGDPLEDRVIIWTRITPDFDTAIQGTYSVATDSGLVNVVKRGTFVTDADQDYTVKIDVDGLNPSTTYYYCFTAFDKRSQVGRTKTTASVGENNLSDVLKFAVVSCANYEGGYFHAYNSIAKRNDLNAVIHLGDYIYEYAAGEYRNARLIDSARMNLPVNELLIRKDYRTRYSLYNLDSNLQLMRLQHPLIAVWDDHEFADNAYDTGAENHQPGEGDWSMRKQIAKEVYYEWMPVRGNAQSAHLYRTISYGKLMDLYMLDTRIDGRQKPPTTFDEPEDTLHPRHMISNDQFNWLVENLKNSKAQWKVIGNQVVFSNLNVGFAAEDPTSYDQISYYENLSTDSWEGYLLQRNALIDSIQKNEFKNVVFLSGDSHSSWAFDVTKEPVLYPLAQYAYLPQPNPYDSLAKTGYNPETGAGSCAVEFCTPSVSAENFAEELGSDSVAAILEYFFNNPIPVLPGNPNYNPHLKFVNLGSHGYMIFDVRGDSVQTDYYYTPDVTSKVIEEYWGGGVASILNSKHISNSSVAFPALPKSIPDIATPAPRVITGSSDIAESALFSVYPNPAGKSLSVFVGINESTDLLLSIYALSGQLVKIIRSDNAIDKGLHSFRNLDISDLKSGVYVLQVRTRNHITSKKIVIK
jgi:alkaline phosphatase D